MSSFEIVEYFARVFPSISPYCQLLFLILQHIPNRLLVEKRETTLLWFQVKKGKNCMFPPTGIADVADDDMMTEEILTKSLCHQHTSLIIGIFKGVEVMNSKSIMWNNITVKFLRFLSPEIFFYGFATCINI